MESLLNFPTVTELVSDKDEVSFHFGIMSVEVQASLSLITEKPGNNVEQKVRFFSFVSRRECTWHYFSWEVGFGIAEMEKLEFRTLG